MKKQDLIDIIPLVLITIAGTASIVEVVTTNYSFSVKQHVGLTLVGISILLFFVNRRIYKYVFGVTLLLGLINIIGFTTGIFTMNFLGIPIQLLILPVILLFAWIYNENIGSIIQQISGRDEEQRKDEKDSRINGYKRRFEKLSDDDINSKLNEKLVPEALEALRQIIIERKNTKTNNLQ